jgi:hypothetical protein
MDFIEYCDKNRVLLAIFPPHSTHSLQPLDVVCFAPLAGSYTDELTTHTQCSQGLLPLKKGDFFLLFWRAWTSAFTEKLILKSFESTGIWPMERDVILKIFHSRTPDEADQPKSSPVIADEDWRRMRALVEDVVKEGEEKSAKKITLSLHHLQVQNNLLLYENKGLRKALTTKKKHKNKGKTLDLQQRQEFHSRAVFWSPSKVNEARFRERIRKREEEEELSPKANNKHMREQAALWIKKQ